MNPIEFDCTHSKTIIPMQEMTRALRDVASDDGYEVVEFICSFF